MLSFSVQYVGLFMLGFHTGEKKSRHQVPIVSKLAPTKYYRMLMPINVCKGGGRPPPCYAYE